MNSLIEIDRTNVPSQVDDVSSHLHEGVYVRLVCESRGDFQYYHIQKEVLLTKIKNPSLLDLLKKKLFNKPYATRTVRRWLTVRTFEDDDPEDPYVENCAREAYDFLTKNYDTNI